MRTDSLPPPPRAPRATAHVTALAAGLHEVEIAGPLVPDWLGRLAAGLAQRGVSVERGHAIADGHGRWAARFEVARGATLDAALVERLLAAEHHAPQSAPIALAACDVRAVTEHGGSLRVAVRAPDCVGLLATLMRRFAYFSLFAVELRLDTRDGIADDEFWLRAGGQRRPAPATGSALRAALGHLLPRDRGVDP